MLGSSWVAAQVAGSQEGLSSVSKCFIPPLFPFTLHLLPFHLPSLFSLFLFFVSIAGQHILRALGVTRFATGKMETSFGVVGTLLCTKRGCKAGTMCVPVYASGKVPPEGAFLRNISETLATLHRRLLDSVYCRRHWQALGTHAAAISVTVVAAISGNSSRSTECSPWGADSRSAVKHIPS
jgi:hypothetical protein